MKSDYEFDSDIVVGLEIHAELATKSKLFCGCARTGSDEPNSRTCPVCLGHPGSKPVLNKRAVEYAVRLCLALGCTVSENMIFSRKSYFYPDMSKNYQITQYEVPLGSEGFLQIESGKIGLTRIHLEEDPASLVHPGTIKDSSYVLVDYNRSGNPLAEIVTKPEITSAGQAREFMKALICVLNYLEIFDVKTCIIKADVNVSIKESGYVRKEIKNVTGFKDVERAIDYEVGRQRRAIKDGEQIRMETLGWDSARGVTFSLRTKETEEDYGYIVDPDLTVIDITLDMTERIRKTMPEMAADKVNKFVRELNIPLEDAKVLAQEKRLAQMFEAVAKKVDPLLAARWIRRELVRVLNYNKLEISDIPFGAEHLVELLSLIQNKKITENTGQKIIEMLVAAQFDIHAYLKENELFAVDNSAEIENACAEAVLENPEAVNDFKAGNEKSFNFIVGCVMKKTRGKARPQEVNNILRRILGK